MTKATKLRTSSVTAAKLSRSPMTGGDVEKNEAATKAARLKRCDRDDGVDVGEM